MAEAFAPFTLQRTIGKLTFYMMEGRNFVRKKSSLTRRKVLYSPQFERTRENATMMGRASKIGSFLYNSLPSYWRQSWMYRSFTGEAYRLLKKGKEELEVRQLLWQQYVQEVAAKPKEAKPLPIEPVPAKRKYRKHDTHYWESKTHKRIQRKVRKQQRQHNAGLFAEASTIASELYRELPARSRKRSYFQELTGWAMKWLKEQEDDYINSDALPPPMLQPDSINITKQQKSRNEIGYINSPKGVFVFLAPTYKPRYRQSSCSSAHAVTANNVNLLHPDAIYGLSIFC